MKDHVSKLPFEKEANSEPHLYTYTGYECEVKINESTKHGDLLDKDEEPMGGVDPIDLTSFASPTLNFNIPNEIPNVIVLEKKDPKVVLEKKDPKVIYKDGQAREWKGSQFLQSSLMVPPLTKRSKPGQKSCNVGNLERESQNFFKKIEDRWSWMSGGTLMSIEWKKIQPSLRRPL
ncbi:hypothetical protein QYF36_018151 [Acer negundo]|nr:hypothetical protein QYF36_018151 [Acer negundo]